MSRERERKEREGWWWGKKNVVDVNDDDEAGPLYRSKSVSIRSSLNSSKTFHSLSFYLFSWLFLPTVYLWLLLPHHHHHDHHHPPPPPFIFGLIFLSHALVHSQLSLFTHSSWSIIISGLAVFSHDEYFTLGLWPNRWNWWFLIIHSYHHEKSKNKNQTPTCLSSSSYFFPILFSA